MFSDNRKLQRTQLRISFTSRINLIAFEQFIARKYLGSVETQNQICSFHGADSLIVCLFLSNDFVDLFLSFELANIKKYHNTLCPPKILHKGAVTL